MTDFATITTSAKPMSTIQHQPERTHEAKVHGAPMDTRYPPSAMERSARSVLVRLENLNTALHKTAAAAKSVSLPLVVDQADFAMGNEGGRDYMNARLGENHKLHRAVQEVLAKAETSKSPAHLLEVELLKLGAFGLPDTLEFRVLAADTLEQLDALSARSQAPSPPLTQASSSDVFFDQLLKMIGFIGEEYLAIYEALVEKYSAFYEEFNREVMAKLGEWITGKDDGKNIEISPELSFALERLMDQWSTAPEGALYPVTNTGGATEDEAKKWAKAMGLPDSCVVPSADNKSYCVMMDLSSLKGMLDSLPRPTLSVGPIQISIPIVWDSAKFQAWQTGFNSNEGDLKNKLQLFTTKYGNANSYHENFNKILSSQLSQFAEMLKSYTSF